MCGKLSPSFALETLTLLWRRRRTNTGISDGRLGLQRQVTVRGIDEQWVETITAATLFRRQSQAVFAQGSVFAEPVISLELERPRGGAAADVDDAPQVTHAEDDKVVREVPISTGNELGGLGFLKDPHDPAAGTIDGVVVDDSAIDTDERDGSPRPDERAVLDGDVLRLVIG